MVREGEWGWDSLLQCGSKLLLLLLLCRLVGKLLLLGDGRGQLLLGLVHLVAVLLLPQTATTSTMPGPAPTTMASGSRWGVVNSISTPSLPPMAASIASVALIASVASIALVASIASIALIASVASVASSPVSEVSSHCSKSHQCILSIVEVLDLDHIID